MSRRKLPQQAKPVDVDKHPFVQVQDLEDSHLTPGQEPKERRGDL